MSFLKVFTFFIPSCWQTLNETEKKWATLKCKCVPIAAFKHNHHHQYCLVSRRKLWLCSAFTAAQETCLFTSQYTHPYRWSDVFSLNGKRCYLVVAVCYCRVVDNRLYKVANKSPVSSLFYCKNETYTNHSLTWKMHYILYIWRTQLRSYDSWLNIVCMQINV